MRYTIYDYIDYTDGNFSPSDEEVVPTRVSPSKDLTIRPFQEVIINEKGDVPTLIYWDSPEMNIPLMREDIVYVRDSDGTKTKGLAITQTKTLCWYYHNDENGTYEVDEKNKKVLLKNYQTGATKDSLGNLLPTASQMGEWKRKSQNAITYMLTKEVAGSPIDQAVFVLFDNIMFSIQKWQNNPVSTAFIDAINNKDGGFEIPLAPNFSMNIWDINVSSNPDNPYTLQTFLLNRLMSIVS